MTRLRSLVAALAAASVGAACAGREEPPAAPSAPAAPAGAGQPAAPDAWRERARAPAELSAGTLVRVASRPPLERGGACPPAEPQPAKKGAAEERPQSAAPPECPRVGDEVEEVEIDWHGTAPPP
jgi:hypothetical protein